MNSQPDPVTSYVGMRLRMRRTLLGLSQEKLAESVGLTFQQIQKYERGSNRIASCRLFRLAEVLGVDQNYFFTGVDDYVSDYQGDKSNPGLAHPPQERYEGEDHMNRRETLDLIRAYYRIGDPEVRKRVADMVKAVGSADEGASGTGHDDRPGD
ncbi:MAG: helix-turn-helix transcriptional regulator [Sphingomonadales bacterium]